MTQFPPPPQRERERERQEYRGKRESGRGVAWERVKCTGQRLLPSLVRKFT